MPEQYLYRFTAARLARMRAWFDGLASSEDRYYEFIEYDPSQDESEPPYPIELFREVIESPDDTGPHSRFAGSFSAHIWTVLNRFANSHEFYEVLMYQVLLEDVWGAGAPCLIMDARAKRQFLQRESKRLPENLREEAWLIRKLCYGALLDEIAKDRAFPTWFLKCNDNFLGLLTSKEARFLKSSGFRYCDYVKTIYEKSARIDAGTSGLMVKSIERFKEAVRSASRSPGGMLVGYCI
jgi:hypothetical protein